MNLTTEMQTALISGTVSPRWLVYFKAKNVSTGLPEYLGIWNDITPLTIQIGADQREYIGAGGLVSIPNFTYEVGTNIQTQDLSLSMLSVEVIELLREYDSRFAEVDIHLALIDNTTNNIVGTALAFKGLVDEATISESENDMVANLTLVSNARLGTQKIYTKQSDSSQRLRDQNDKGRIYADIGNAYPVSWGQVTDQVPNFKSR